jgi:putative transposase
MRPSESGGQVQPDLRQLLLCKAARRGDQWHLGEVFLKINGRLHYLWRAVDQDGEVLEILVLRQRDKKAARKFLSKVLKGLQ